MRELQPLLIELGTEELPPKALDELSSAFADGICQGLKAAGIDADTEHARRYCSPRRLAVHVPAVAVMQPEQAIERRGPAVQAGRAADGTPSKALLGFAQSCGVDVDALQTLQTDKGAWFVHRATRAGQPTALVLPQILGDTLKNLPIPRPMRWGDHDYSFVRPAHWLVVLHGADVVDVQALGLVSGRQSRGHRFHHPEPVAIAHADNWLDALRGVRVLADPAERRQRVRDQVAIAASGTAGQAQLSDALLDEIANLTEWPVGIACAFDKVFLEVPAEALVTTMQTNQKFVPVTGADGRLSEHFIGVANIESSDPAEIRKGYERVIRPRFADARFFYTEDLKTPLSGYQEGLKAVTYQQSLGSVWDKCVRVAELARVIANRLREGGVDVDAALATHAAALSKCDLLTRMVGEFPELQGVMGRYYALAQGEPAEVADALDSFYQPRYAADAIASGKLGQVVAVAERLDTLAGIFAVGMHPSGSKDPFALRRAALGLARTLVEGDLGIDLKAAFAEALDLIPEAALAAGLKPGKNGAKAVLDAGARRRALVDALHDFVLERLRSYYAEQGFGPGVFAAVAAVHPSNLPDFDRRLRAVAAFAERPEAASLAAANKRVGNILRKQAEESAATDPANIDPANSDAHSVDMGSLDMGTIDPGQFENAAEQDLHAALQAAGADSDRSVAAGDYAAALTRLAALQVPVDRFFDQVLVMADVPAVRANRLALLAALKRQFMAIADIARV